MNLSMRYIGVVGVVEGRKSEGRQEVELWFWWDIDTARATISVSELLLRDMSCIPIEISETCGCGS